MSDDVAKLWEANEKAIAEAKALRLDGRTRQARARKKEKEDRRRRGFRRLSPDEYTTRFEVQYGTCAGCLKTPASLGQADLADYHGVALLCRFCRAAAGFLKHEPAVAERLVRIMERSWLTGSEEPR